MPRGRRWAMCSSRRGFPTEALEAYRRATALARDDDVEWARLVLRRARVRERSGSFVTALRELRVAERRLEGSTSDEAIRVRVAVETMRAIVHEGQEQPRRALAAAERAAAEAEAIGELRDLANAFNVIDWAHVFVGDLDKAVHQPRIVEIYHSLGRAASSCRRPRQPGRGLLLAGSLGRGTGLLLEGPRGLRAERRRRERGGPPGQRRRAAHQPRRPRPGPARRSSRHSRRTERSASTTARCSTRSRSDACSSPRATSTRPPPCCRRRWTRPRPWGCRAPCWTPPSTSPPATWPPGAARTALEVLASAEQGAGPEAAVLRAHGRAGALAGPERARRRRGGSRGPRCRHHRGRGLDLQYELGCLLLLDDDTSAREEGRALLDALGVQSAQLSG